MPANAVEQRLMQNMLSRERVRRLLGVTEQQLRRWESLNLIARSDTYSMRDLAKLRKVLDLTGGRVSGRRLKNLIHALAQRERVDDPLSELRIYTDEYGSLKVDVEGHTTDANSGQILLDFEEPTASRAKAVKAFPGSGSTSPAAAAPVRTVDPEEMKRRSEAERWFARGLELEQTGGPASEIRIAYEKAVTLDPQSTGALVNLGTLHFNSRSLARAEKYYLRALEADPKYALAHFNLGNLHDERGDPAKALEHYEKALELNPSYSDAHYNLALLHQNQGQNMKAVRHWKAYLKLDPRSNWADIARRELEKLKNAALVK